MSFSVKRKGPVVSGISHGNRVKQPDLYSINTLRAAVIAGLAAFSAQVLSYDTPTNLRVDDDNLVWRSDAPSINIYEDGEYRATVHGESMFGPIYDGSIYQVVAHDHGMEFSSLSDPLLVVDDDDDEDDDDDDEDVVEYSEARLYFELNDTDGDLGLHALIDGDEWKTMHIEDKTGRTLLALEVTNGLLSQGMTELFFESAEPDFDDLEPADFFGRFPAGEYEANGETLDGRKLESELQLSHVIPAAPANILVNGQAVPADCDEQEPPIVSGPLLLSWGAVVSSHATLGTPGEVIVDNYQVVLEREEPSVLQIVLDVSSAVTQLEVPSGLMSTGDEIKIEVLTIAENGNQSATESCFRVD